MRTELSVLTEGPRTVSSVPRDVVREYNKPKRRIVQYKAGDCVLYRFGAGQPFKGVGTIVGVAGSNAYLVETNHGYKRVYNQSNLKARYDSDTQCVDVKNAAYDAVSASECNETIVHEGSESECVPEVANTALASRYNLRKRKADPIVYKD